MDLVRHILVCGTTALVLAPTTIASPPHRPVYCGTARWEAYIAEAANRFDLPERWLHAVIRIESAGCERMDGHPTTSTAGAMGLMQLMPQTWLRLREHFKLGTDPYDPHDNILAGAAYLRVLYDRYAIPGAFIAYHAGPRRYEDYLSGARALPPATRAYISHVERLLAAQPSSVVADAPLAQVVDRARTALFVIRRTPESSTEEPAARQAREALFVDLRLSVRRSARTTTSRGDYYDVHGD
jgi:Transglycosylase SLT domain